MANRFYIPPENNVMRDVLGAVSTIEGIKSNKVANELAKERMSMDKGKFAEEKRSNLVSEGMQQKTQGLNEREVGLAEKRFNAEQKQMDLVNKPIMPTQLRIMEATVAAQGKQKGFKSFTGSGSKQIFQHIKDLSASGMALGEVYKNTYGYWDTISKPALDDMQAELTSLKAKGETEKAQQLEMEMMEFGNKDVVKKFFPNASAYYDNQQKLIDSKTAGRPTTGSLTEGSVAKNLLDLASMMDGHTDQNNAKLNGMYRSLINSGLSREDAYNEVLQSVSGGGAETLQPKSGAKKGTDFSNLWNQPEL